MKRYVFQHSLDLQKMKIINCIITKKKITEVVCIHIRKYYADIQLRFIKNSSTSQKAYHIKVSN